VQEGEGRRRLLEKKGDEPHQEEQVQVREQIEIQKPSRNAVIKTGLIKYPYWLVVFYFLFLSVIGRYFSYNNFHGFYSFLGRLLKFKERLIQENDIKIL